MNWYVKNRIASLLVHTSKVGEHLWEIGNAIYIFNLFSVVLSAIGDALLSITAGFLNSSQFGHTTLLRRWIKGRNVDSTSQQRRAPSGSMYLRNERGNFKF